MRTYGRIGFVDEAKYLGILLGRSTTTVDIFRGSFDKFLQRVGSYKHYLKSVSLNKRILVANIFLLPLFYYLAQYYVMPYTEVVSPAKEILRKIIIPFNGGGFGYGYLVAPKSNFGVHSPLRDLWAHNIALLSSKAGNVIVENNGNETPQMGSNSVVTKGARGGKRDRWDSMVIDQHRAYAAFSYMEDYCPRNDNGTIDTTHLKGIEGKDRPKLYKDLAESGYWQNRMDPSRPTSVPTKVMGWTKDQTLAKTSVSLLTKQRKIIGKFFSSYCWNLQFKLFMNCWATDTTRNNRGMTVEKRSDDHSGYPCYFCGEGPDSLQHLLQECTVVKIASRTFLDTLKVQKDYTISNVLLLFETNDVIESIALMNFNCAIWIQREFYKTQDGLPEQAAAIQRLIYYATNSMPLVGGKGEASAAICPTHQLAIDPPANATVVYTDGSAMSDPRHAGAGLWIRGPVADGVPSFDISISVPLGLGDNNLGEMWGIYVAFKCLKRLKKRGIDVGDANIIFSDSMGCIAYHTHTWPTPTELNISRASRRIYHKFFLKQHGRMYWVKGHANVDGNERADVRAKKGARSSLDGKSPRNGISIDHHDSNPQVKSVITVRWLSKTVMRFYQ
jgi:ribonuclease HI